MSDRNFRFSIDRGGTFTDIFCEIASGEWKTKYVTEKLLSEDPSNYKDAVPGGGLAILILNFIIPFSSG